MAPQSKRICISRVYIRHYPFEEVQWLVMLGLDGIMETAFPPEDVETYLVNPHFTRLGTLEELGV